jgi:hypothetical protein
MESNKKAHFFTIVIYEALGFKRDGHPKEGVCVCVRAHLYTLVI